MTAPPDVEREALGALAEAWGVQVAHVDAFGEHREAEPEAVAAVLRALGAPLERPADAPDALRERARQVWTRMLEPVTVVWEGEAGEALLRLPADASEPLRGEVVLEGGGSREVRAAPDGLAVADSADLGGRRAVARRLPLPDGLPRGYHRLRLEREGRTFESLVVRAPRTAYGGEEARRWGVFLPLYALRSGRNWGAGDYTDLRDLAGWTARQGGHLVGTVPLLAAFLDEPFDPSPYSPASRLFWSEAYVDPERAPGWSEAVLAAVPPGREALEEERAALREAPEVDLRRLMRLKREVLGRLARRFFLAGGEREPEFAAYLERVPLAREYARFRAAVELRGRGWGGWPERMRSGELRPGDYGADGVAYHLFVQWLADRQLAEAAGHGAGRGAGLYLDLPLGAHPEGFDTWRFRDHFASGVAAGAPPDDFFREGQNWGLPPLHPERIRERGYAYTRACLGHSLRRARALRVDHVMGLHRLFWVPEGAPAREGLYVRYREEELWAILCLESHRHRAAVVGEDLGTVPPEVRAALEAHDVDGMYVVQFEARPDPEEALPAVPRRSLATLNTHDMYPFAAFWSGADIQDRRERGLLDAEAAARERDRRKRIRTALATWLGGMALFDGPPTGEKVLRATIAVLGASPARTVVANLEDLWLEPRPQNVPGTPAGDNWRRKARHPLEELLDVPSVQRALGTLAHLRGTGRPPARGSGDG